MKPISLIVTVILLGQMMSMACAADVKLRKPGPDEVSGLWHARGQVS